jgi:hypothetical protein
MRHAVIVLATIAVLSSLAYAQTADEPPQP